jgi:ergothioneine biosynthesis protein EgtB
MTTPTVSGLPSEAASSRAPRSPAKPASLADRFANVRKLSERIAAPLSPEDCAIQSMPDVSPTRWHLAHTTWFFETFVLAGSGDYVRYRPDFEYLFNSYYNSVGRQFPRARRGLLSRPGLADVQDYRAHVDRKMLDRITHGLEESLAAVVELGLNHEQQHQELMLTDIKHVLSCNPIFPTYLSGKRRTSNPSGASWDALASAGLAASNWRRYRDGVYEVGHAGQGFAYDNESPRHRQFAEPFELATRLVTCGEYLQFIDDGGYQRPELWLSPGWQRVCDENWTAPLYWIKQDRQWSLFTLGGQMPLAMDEPVCHVSFFEVDAFARWAGARLPTEAEWEIASADIPITGGFVDRLLDTGCIVHPGSAEPGCDADGDSTPTAGNGANSNDVALQQMFADVWQWTASSYAPYPGYRAPPGALGEYNGKFMCNQYVLRGGSCATPSGHIRATYRNFFPPEARWQFSGIRLAKSI